MHLHFPLGNAIPPYIFIFHFMKRLHSLLLLFLLYETLTLLTSLFFIVKSAIPPYIFIFHSFKRCSLHIPSFSTLWSAGTPLFFFFYPMKHSPPYLSIFIVKSAILLHTSFFALWNAIPSTYLLFPLYETLVLLTSSFSTLWNTDTPCLSIFYCKRAIPSYIFIFHSFKRCFSPHTIVFPLYETLALPIPLFLHSMKHSRFISLYFLL